MVLRYLLVHNLSENQRIGVDMNIQLISYKSTGEYIWHWPSNTIEHFEQSWTGEIAINSKVAPFCHAIGKRMAYGRERVHSVTWIAGSPRVEGVEADDYERTHALISLLRQPNKKLVYMEQDIPPGYDGFTIVPHQVEIKALYSRRSLAVKIVSDDIETWAKHAAIRTITFEKI